MTARWMKAARTAVAGALLAVGGSAFAADFVLYNLNDPGVGFNDPTPVAPVGGNTGTTLGQQRINAFVEAGKIWGAKLKSRVPIRVAAIIAPLPCTATGAVLGAAGPTYIFLDFPNAPKPGTWYVSALANKLAREDLVPGPLPAGDDADIIAFFNSNLGKPDCLAGIDFYLGLDNNHGTQIDLLSTLLHEFGHGLGFISLAGEAGDRFDDGTGGKPDVWEGFMYDNAQRKTWLHMTQAERARSSVTPRSLVWAGDTVRRSADRVLDRGSLELFVSGPGLNRFLLTGEAQFGPRADDDARPRRIVQTVDGTGTSLACTPLTPESARAVRGNIALIDRGSCTFTVKVANAQAAGARAVLVADNAAGSPPAELAGTDATITIPAARITLADGAAIKSALAASPRFVTGLLRVNDEQLRGADRGQRVFLWTPNPYQSGSSVSHWDTLAKRNLLMEPFANDDDGRKVKAPYDLTFELLKDIGW